MLQIVDGQWKDHLYSLDHLKEGIGLRGYGQRDPLVEYKKESFQLFQDMRGADRRGDRPLPVVAAAGRPERSRCRPGAASGSSAAAAPPAGAQLQQPVAGVGLGVRAEAGRPRRHRRLRSSAAGRPVRPGLAETMHR